MRRADLGPVIEDRRSRKREERERGELQRLSILPRDEQEAVHVVIVQEAHAAGSVHHVRLVEIEERVEVHERPLSGREGESQRPGEGKVEDGVDASAVAAQRVAGIGRLADRDDVGIYLLERFLELDPEVHAVTDHVVEPESVDAALHPEPRAALQVLAHPLAHRVQRDEAGHHVEEAAVAVGPLVKGEPVGRLGVPVASRGDEGRVLYREVAGHEVEKHAHAALVRGRGKRPQVVHVTENRVHGEVVGRVVAVIRGCRTDGREPEAGNAQLIEIGNRLQDAGEVTAVLDLQVCAFVEGPAAAAEPVDEDLVDNRLVEPPRRHRTASNAIRKDRDTLRRRIAIPEPLAVLRANLLAAPGEAHDLVADDCSLRLRGNGAPPPNDVSAERTPVGPGTLHDHPGRRLARQSPVGRVADLRALHGGTGPRFRFHEHILSGRRCERGDRVLVAKLVVDRLVAADDLAGGQVARRRRYLTVISHPVLLASAYSAARPAQPPVSPSCARSFAPPAARARRRPRARGRARRARGSAVPRR